MKGVKRSSEGKEKKILRRRSLRGKQITREGNGPGDGMGAAKSLPRLGPIVPLINVRRTR